MNHENYRDQLFPQSFIGNMLESEKQEPPKYVVTVDLADVLRAFSDGMVTAYNLGLMARNIESKAKQKDAEGNE